LFRVVPTQIDKELTVRKAVDSELRPVHGQRCLADTGRSRDHRDGHVRTRFQKRQIVERGEGLGATGESADPGRKVPRDVGQPDSGRGLVRAGLPDGIVAGIPVLRRKTRIRRPVRIDNRSHRRRQPQLVELVDVTAECFDDQLQQTPSRHPGLRKCSSHSGSAHTDLTAEVSQARPAGVVVELVQRVDKPTSGWCRHVRLGQRPHRRLPHVSRPVQERERRRWV